MSFVVLCPGQQMTKVAASMEKVKAYKMLDIFKTVRQSDYSPASALSE